MNGEGRHLSAPANTENSATPFAPDLRSLVAHAIEMLDENYLLVARARLVQALDVIDRGDR